LQEATKANPYEYANDNPVNNVDGSGRASVLDLFDQCILGGANAFSRGLLAVIAIAGIGSAIAAVSAGFVLSGIVAGIGAFVIGYCLGYATDPRNS
jgi:hypothetical protein